MVGVIFLYKLTPQYTKLNMMYLHFCNIMVYYTYNFKIGGDKRVSGRCRSGNTNSKRIT